MATETEQPSVVADPHYAAILADPVDDTVRLAYADHLDEIDRPDDARRIRAMFERLKYPAQPPFTLCGICVPRGPNYYEMVESADSGLSVGMRMTVRSLGTAQHRLRGKTYHNLLVTKITVDDPDLGTVRVSFKRDAESVKYPVALIKPMETEISMLITRYVESIAAIGHIPRGFRLVRRDDVPIINRMLGSWAESHVVLRPPGFAPGTFRPLYVGFDRGFPGHVDGITWFDWERYSDALIEMYPITRVRVVGAVSASRIRNTVFRSDPNGRPGIAPSFNIAGRPVTITRDEIHHAIQRVYRDDEINDSRSDFIVKLVLSKRWPTIPVSGWEIPDLRTT